MSTDSVGASLVRPRPMTERPPKDSAARPFVVVGIGAAAGGASALRALFENLDGGGGMAFVVLVQPGQDEETERLPQTLEAATDLDVGTVDDGVALEPNRIYLDTCGKAPITVRDSRFERETGSDNRLGPVDRLFHSLSEELAHRAVGIVLSGATTDGTLGLKAISDAGGMTIAQSSETASFAVMPRNAATLGVADHVLAPEAMGAELLAYADNVTALSRSDHERMLRDAIEDGLPIIVERLERETGHDFRHYKTATLIRRVQRRMQVLHLASIEDYVAWLGGSRDEAQALFRELLIGVTAFFRDRGAFDALADQVIPSLFDARDSDELVRIWVPGCATGEEPYTIAMLVREELDRRDENPAVQIIATDIDDHALDIARRGAYAMGIAADVSPERLQRFFVKRGQRYHVAKSIRELCLFSHHNLIRDPPFSRQDLISCRNLLIYLGPHLQKKLIPMFHYALRRGGFLFLGPSEGVGGHQELFSTVDAKHSISQRRPVDAPAAKVVERTEHVGKPWPKLHRASDPTADIAPVMQRVLVDEFAPHAVVVDEEGRIVCASGDMSKYLNVGSGPFRNHVVKLTRPGLRVGLRAALAEASAAKRRVTRDKLSVRVDDGVQSVMITVQPMPDLGAESELNLVVFEDVGLPVSRHNADAQPAADEANALIERLDAELQTTRDDLETTVRDLEATNEELKSSNEELRSMNEELQSANEELETRKQDIQQGHEALGRARTDLENLIFTTEIAAVILDDEQRIRRFTPAVARIYNLIESDVGRPLWHQTHRAIDMPPLPDAAALSADDAVVEDLLQTKEGRWFVRRVRPYRTGDSESDGTVISFTDVTELTESEERFRVMADNVPDVVFRADESLEWTFVNSRFFQWTNVSEVEARGRGWMKLMPPDDREKTKEALDRAIRGGEPLQVEHRLKLSDGSLRWFVTRAVPLPAGDDADTEWFGTMTDIHDVKQTQQALGRAEAQRRLALDAGQLGVYEVDLDQDTIVLDERARELLGVSGESIPVRTVIARVHPEDRAAVKEVLASATTGTEDGRARVEFRVELAGRGELWIAANARAHHETDDGGSCNTRLIGTLQEITGRKRTERKLREARRAAESASRAKSRFLANVSHEIRTPMTAILGYADVLAKKLTDADALDYVDTIRRNGRFLLEILNDVLDLSKIEANQLDVRKERFRPDAVVAEVRSLMEAQAIEKGIALLLEFDGKLPETIESDPNRLRQILLNLVSNAIKFTEHGSVRLVARMLAAEEKLVFEVIDTGVGIPSDQKQALFDPFAQADTSPSRRFMGTGLGLTISRRLAHLLGGEIGVDSELGRGSTFRFTVATGSLEGVPLVVPSTEIIEPDERGGLSVPTIEGSILVVDDRREVRALAKHFLEEAGARVSAAGDGREAIDMVARARRDYDLIVMDMQMPGMDGYEAVSRLRSNGFDGPIIALTAHAMRGEREKCLAAGCDDYASKPIESGALVAMIARYLERARVEHNDDASREARHRILLVDDARDLLESKRILLESRGHEVRVASSGAAALDAAAAFDANVAILDLGLPDMSGHELATRLKEASMLPNAVFLALSGSDAEAVRERSRDVGFDAHLVKPVDIDELEAAIMEALCDPSDTR